MEQSNALILLENYKKDLKKKVNWRIVYVITIVIVLCFLLLIITDCGNGESIVIQGIVNINFIFPYRKKGLLLTIILWFIFVSAIYLLFATIKSCHRYNNSLHKIDLLTMRIKLNTDKDLITPYRLDRELEMIYRILES